jgi:SAM-dependent methyltransferase
MTDTQDAVKRKRLQSEESYHDKAYSQQGGGPAHYALGPTYYIFKQMLADLGDVSDKHILECGCGSGWITVELSALGGKVTAFDISGESVKSTLQFLDKKDLRKNCVVEKKSAEDLDYPDASFDIVLGFAILHHIDLNKVIPHIHRVLKPSGYAIFAEPLGCNPFLNIYRKLTPQYRTPDETPLRLDEFSNYLKDFKYFAHREYYLLSLIPLFLTNLKFFKLKPQGLQRFMALDSWLFNRIPFLRKWAWYSILRFGK